MNYAIPPRLESVPVDGPVRVLFAAGKWAPDSARLDAAQRNELLRVRDTSPPYTSPRPSACGVAYVQTQPARRKKLRGAYAVVAKVCEKCKRSYTGTGNQKFCANCSESIKKRGKR